MEFGWVGEKVEVIVKVSSPIQAMNILSYQRHKERLIFWKDS